MWNAKHGSLRFHGSCCFAGKAIFLNIFFKLTAAWVVFFATYRYTPDRARREQPIGGLGFFLCVRARVRSVWRVEISGILKSSISRIHSFFTGGGSRSEATATLPQDRRRNIADVPAPWGVAPQQGALRDAIARYDDSDGRREVSCPLVL